MVKSIFYDHSCFILSICLSISIIYFYVNVRQLKTKDHFFIPDNPNMSEYYKKINEIKKPKNKYFMTIPVIILLVKIIYGI